MKDIDDNVQLYAASAVAAIAEKVDDRHQLVTMLIDILKHGSEASRYTASWVLSKIPDDGTNIIELIPELLEALKDENEAVRFSVATTLLLPIYHGMDVTFYLEKFVHLLQDENARNDILRVLLEVELNEQTARKILEITRADISVALICIKLTDKCVQFLDGPIAHVA